MKKAIIVSCFGSYFFEERLKYVYRSFVKHNFDVKILMSNFNHTKKERIVPDEYPDYVELISTRVYRKNLSIDRVLSHIEFSNRIKYKIEEYHPDIIYYLMPPNVVGNVISSYKRKHSGCYVIADVMDLWPESLPIPWFHSKINIIENIWRLMRTNSLTEANYIIFECKFYKDELKVDENCDVIYLPMREFNNSNEETEGFDEKIIKIAYIGQVSHIIDMDLIEAVLREIACNHKVELHVIGTGSNYDNFIFRMKSVVTKIYEYGAVYDSNRIQKLIGACHFGLNIMKDNVQVGLTMKSMIYIGLGIPIINNIKGDTWDLVEKYSVGVNVVKRKFHCDDITAYQTMHKNMNRLQKEVFSTDAIQKKFDDVIGKLVFEVDRRL